MVVNVGFKKQHARFICFIYTQASIAVHWLCALQSGLGSSRTGATYCLFRQGISFRGSNHICFGRDENCFLLIFDKFLRPSALCCWQILSPMLGICGATVSFPELNSQPVLHWFLWKCGFCVCRHEVCLPTEKPAVGLKGPQTHRMPSNVQLAHVRSVRQTSQGNTKAWRQTAASGGDAWTYRPVPLTTVTLA